MKVSIRAKEIDVLITNDDKEPIAKYSVKNYVVDVDVTKLLTSVTSVAELFVKLDELALKGVKI